MGDARKALVRSQGGSGVGLALSACFVNRLTIFTPQVFRVILFRRLHFPLPLTVCNCRCGPQLDIYGHHRAVGGARAGVLAGRGWALENVVVRICREAGGRVTTNVLVGNLDLIGPNVEDTRRVEVVADGLPLCGGAQLTRQWSVHCVLTAPPRGGQRPTKEWRQQRLDAGNAGLIPSWLVCTEGRALWFSRWSWRPMVARNAEFSLTIGQCKGQGGNRVDATTCGAVLAFMVGFVLGVHCRSGAGFHDVGIAWRSRRRW